MNPIGAIIALVLLYSIIGIFFKFKRKGPS